ncbi:MAG: hypothetical protein Q8L21_03680, partial [Candidatus Komeilibacteria bacterium]|nr:hypothetical protein [Candidatus Komeilibacteria bacterium]
MKKSFFIFLLIIAALFVFGQNKASAHQPRLVGESTVINVQNPEVSQAFYGVLSSEPVVYRLEAKEP